MTQVCEMLEARLQEVLHPLQMGNCEEAERLMSTVGALLTPPIDEEHLDRLRELQQKCLAAAKAIEVNLIEQLRQSGASRRATSAYQNSSIEVAS